MFRSALTAAFLIICALDLNAQWVLQQSQTIADLRGIDSFNDKVAWASGTNGTVLRTTDGGEHWLICATPSGAEHLDFRAVQGFDAHTAIVMSAGKGALSRLYKTTDDCRSWRLILTNPDADGFWDAMKFTVGEKSKPNRTGVLYGDPVDGKFVEYRTHDFGESWNRSRECPDARKGEALFAASNSSVLYTESAITIVTGGSSGSRSRARQYHSQHDPQVPYQYVGGDIPLAVSETAGAFSVATSLSKEAPSSAKQKKRIRGVYAPPVVFVAVGGDFQHPEISQETAAFTTDGGEHWTASTKPPHGYRSSVVYDGAAKTWIAVGPNGTDISTDGGRNWRPLVPKAADHEPEDADRKWNAISLPFVVGPHGRIGKLKSNVLQP